MTVAITKYIYVACISMLQRVFSSCDV